MNGAQPAIVKGLFYQLVKVVGGVEAAGAYLGISHQRVSQLQSPSCADMPTFLQVMTLEGVAKRSVVFGALAKLVEAQDGAADLAKEACEVVEAAVDLHRIVRKGGTAKEVQTAAATLQREVADLPPLLAANQS